MLEYSVTVVVPPAAEPIDLAEAKAHVKAETADEDTLIAGLITTAREYCEKVQNRAYITQTIEMTLNGLPATDRIQLRRPPLQSVESLVYTDSRGIATTWDPANYLVNTRRYVGELVLGYGKAWPAVPLQPTNGVTVTYVAGYATPFTVNTAAGTLTALGRSYANGDRVQLSNSGGALPGGLKDRTVYHVVNADGSTFQLALAAGGAPVAITSEGTGSHFLGVVPKPVIQAMLLLIGHWYERREAVLTGSISKEIEFAVSSLLSLDRVF